MKEELAVRRGAPQLVGEDPSLRKLFASLQRAAATDTTVLIEGESGTGKELFARSLHALSPRADAPFVAINCAAIPETLLETELFGHEKGAFTGAVARKPGKFEMAHRGTLFLDEIGEMPLSLQAKILRALEERRFERVGGTASVQVDVRLVAATNRGLQRRRRGAPVPRGSVLPAVGVSDHRSAAARAPRRHPAAGALLRRRFCRDMKKRPLALSPAALEQLLAYRWPGNVRELQNCIERAVILAESEAIQARHLNLSLVGAVRRSRRRARGRRLTDRSAGRRDAARGGEVERIKLETALKEADNNKGRASELLQISYKMLLSKLRSIGWSERSGTEADGLSPRAWSSSAVTSVTVVVAPIAVGSTKWRRPPTTFLSRPAASTAWLADRSPTAEAAPSG